MSTDFFETFPSVFIFYGIEVKITCLSVSIITCNLLASSQYMTQYITISTLIRFVILYMFTMKRHTGIQDQITLKEHKILSNEYTSAV
jgi:hypothetical protein